MQHEEPHTESPATATCEQPNGPEAATDESHDASTEQGAQARPVELHPWRIAVGLGLIVACCSAALALHATGWMAWLLTAIATIGGAVASTSIMTRSKRPALMRTVFAVTGALAVLALQPVEIVASLL